MDKIKLLEKLKWEKIEGKTIDLIPCKEEHLQFIVDLRNKPNVKYYLNQKFDLTIDLQREWFINYKNRLNDLYYIIADKAGNWIGTNSLYDIAINKQIGEKGRLIVDEKYNLSNPYALEADIIILKIAFELLDLKKIITINKCDNFKMIEINKKLGFVQTGTKEIRGMEYLIFESTKINIDNKYLKLIEYWRNRNERIKAKKSI